MNETIEIEDADGGWGEHELKHCDDCEDEDGCAPDEPSCTRDEGHAWHRGDAGGIDENPGCWSLGGTTMLFEDRCVACGVRRKHVAYGWQRNPGQCDTIEYDEREVES